MRHDLHQLRAQSLADEMVKRRAEDDSDDQHSSRNSRRKIQVSFRHLNLRQNNMKDVDEAAAKIQAGFRGYKVRKELKEKEKDRLESGICKETNDSIKEETQKRHGAAAKIQAGVRGFLVRRRNHAEQEAAKKIQAGFRGFKVRKEVKSLQNC